MAKIKENKKGFKIIEISRAELVGRLAEYGCIGICDNCNSTSITGYYIAVLNQWFCQKCFYEWYNKAVNYPEDRNIEEKNFEFYKKLFEL